MCTLWQRMKQLAPFTSAMASLWSRWRAATAHITGKATVLLPIPASEKHPLVYLLMPDHAAGANVWTASQVLQGQFYFGISCYSGQMQVKHMCYVWLQYTSDAEGHPTASTVQLGPGQMCLYELCTALCDIMA